MRSKEIRATFLEFFHDKGHLILPSFSLIPQDDPTLLLVGAGMAPLKPYFTGEKTPPHPRVATCQKCVRTPDIEKVGKTARHATFFEMLGNFSFGDYFKEEAIKWAWELVTEGYNLPREKLWVSIYQEDEEAFNIWHKKVGLSKDRILRLGKEDNFWEIGPGPCGPCSEIYYDLGPDQGCGSPDCQAGCDCDRYLEIWNLVFTQFNREKDGRYTPLSKKNIDTGAGLERLAVVLQGVKTLFEIDTVKPIFNYFWELVQNGKEKPGEEQEISLRIISEHLRGITFMVGDGVVPSNEGRGYVLRRIIRRAVRHGRLLEIEGPFLYKAAPIVISLMGEAYPEIVKRQEYIQEVVKIEEERFQETLGQGINILENYIAEMQEKNRKVFPGDVAFKLYDTFGFPRDLTQEILAEKGMELDVPGFEKALDEQRERARAAYLQSQEKKERDISFATIKDLRTTFCGYDSVETKSKILALLVGGKPVSRINQGEKGYLVLDRTPFYAERGGQVGDTGIIEGPDGAAAVEDTILGGDEQIIHIINVNEGALAVESEVCAQVDAARRRAACRNHTATHLLHKTLRQVIGDHVWQAGSLVSPERLRFDFTHHSGLTEGEMLKLEEIVNEKIWDNLFVEVIETSLAEAQEMGAVALFEGKYEDRVRVVKIGDYSLELCGGTHVSSTAEIGIFKIVNEEGIGAGVRRIEALTGKEAYSYLSKKERALRELAGMLKSSPDNSLEKLNDFLLSYKKLQKEKRLLQEKISALQVDSLLRETDQSMGFPVLSVKVTADGMDSLRILADQLKARLKSGVVVLGAEVDKKVLLVAAVSPDLVKKGVHAGYLISKVAAKTGGGGGGRPEMAQAGGKDPSRLNEALAEVQNIVKSQYTG